MIYDADKLGRKPDAELRQVIATLEAASASSQSEARYDRECKDGSVLTVTSREGGAPTIATTPPPEK